MKAAPTAVLAAGMLVAGSLAWAQFGRFADTSVDARLARPDSFDGGFQYCRAAYRTNPFGDGGTWLTDYPLAEINLSTRLAELTRIPVSVDAAGHPRHLIVRLTGDELFQCPFIMMQEVGRAFFSDEDATRLREYLLKGGFLWVDDFWGSRAWDAWETQIRKVLPPAEYPILDLAMDHPIFSAMFAIEHVRQIPGIGHWRRSGGDTSERGADSAEMNLRGIADHDGRLMVFMTHNTDVSDSWEREGVDPRYFYAFSTAGYPLAVNVVLYAMTH